MDENVDYKVMAESFKDEANEAYQKGEVEKSIELYSQAINIDPDNHVYYSNRSAAYMKNDSKSKALRDAEKCVELAPKWAKGYNRLGVAQQSLKRFTEAMDSFKKGIELEPSNPALWSALSACQADYEKDKEQRFSEAAAERQKEEEKLQRADEEKARREHEKSNQKLNDFLNEMGGTSSSPSSSSSAAAGATVSGVGEDDLLSGFFSEINHQQAAATQQKQSAFESAAAAIKHESKYANQDLGDAESQFQRLTQKNYEWRNLNPYYVLQLGIDATDEDIKQRYKNLSRKVHPDKLLGKENAREAFEQVKTAYQKLTDEKQRSVVVMNIEYIHGEVMKERRRLIAKGIKESDLAPLQEELERREMKHFAEIEMQKRRSETNLRFYSARERIQEDQEKEKMRLDEEKEKAWAEVERREARMGDWRSFQEDPDAKRVRLASYKEEHRTDEKHGKVKLEEWKKSWK